MGFYISLQMVKLFNIQFYEFWQMHITVQPLLQTKYITVPSTSPRPPGLHLGNQSFPLPSVPGYYWYVVYLYSFTFQRASYKWNHIVNSLFFSFFYISHHHRFSAEYGPTLKFKYFFIYKLWLLKIF